jgi:hypothetical protein
MILLLRGTKEQRCLLNIRLPWHDWVLGSPWGLQLLVSCLLMVSLGFAYASIHEPAASKSSVTGVSQWITRYRFSMLKLTTTLVLLRYEVWRCFETLPLRIGPQPFGLMGPDGSVWWLWIEGLLLTTVLMGAWGVTGKIRARPAAVRRWWPWRFLLPWAVLWPIWPIRGISILDVRLMNTSMWTWWVMALPVTMALALWWIITKTTPIQEQALTEDESKPAAPLAIQTDLPSPETFVADSDPEPSPPATTPESVPPLVIVPEGTLTEAATIPPPAALHRGSNLYPMIQKAPPSSSNPSSLQQTPWVYPLVPAVCVQLGTPESVNDTAPQAPGKVVRILGMGYVRAVSQQAFQLVVPEPFTLPKADFWIRIQWHPHEPVELYPVAAANTPHAPTVWITQAQSYVASLQWAGLSPTQRQQLTARLLPTTDLLDTSNPDLGTSLATSALA